MMSMYFQSPFIYKTQEKDQKGKQGGLLYERCSSVVRSKLIINFPFSYVEFCSKYVVFWTYLKKSIWIRGRKYIMISPWHIFGLNFLQSCIKIQSLIFGTDKSEKGLILSEK